MTEQTLRKLNPTEAVIDALPRIIEAFVTFYGESERENITNKFKNMLVIGYSRPYHISSIINKSDRDKTNKLITEFLDRLTTKEEEKEKISNLFFARYEFDNATLQPINKYMNYVNGNNKSDYIKKQVVEFLQQIYPETTIDNLDELIKLGTFKNIDVILPIYEQILEKYQKYLIKIRPYKDYVESSNNLNLALEKKYTYLLVEELKDLFTESEYHEIQERLNTRNSHYIKDVNGKTKNYISYSLNGKVLVEAFNDENDELLVNGKSWRKDSIKKDRIQYFKNLGLDLGDDYEVYQNDPRAKTLIPSKELIERIVNKGKKLHEQMINEYYKSIPEYQKNRSRIDSLDLLDKDDGYNANAYESEVTRITTNLKLIDGKYVEYPILFLYVGGLEEYLDHNLIHELNHVYELCFHNIKDNYCQMTCGWDIVDGKINSTKEENVSLPTNQEKRKYELFNEIINELIAQEITEIIIENGQYIFNTKENMKIKGGTSYEHTLFLVKDFYILYKQEIIESRKNGDMSKLFETIGKENFEALNQLFHEYTENFNQFAIYKVYRELQAGIETENTKKYRELIFRRDEILEKMKEQSHKRISSL